ncbi:MAG: transposase [Myxococcales bacterium]|nr:transposase [Myxococcales bacterium]
MQHSAKFKEKLITKALRPENSIGGTAKSAGIPKATLYTWIQRARMGSMSKDSSKKRV